MAKYIKQEVPDLHKTGEQKVFYRLRTERNVDFDEFVLGVVAQIVGELFYKVFIQFHSCQV